MGARIRKRRTRAAMIIEKELAKMPLTKKGAKIKRAMAKEYGAKKGERVFYASRNKGTIKGVDRSRKK